MNIILHDNKSRRSFYFRNMMMERIAGFGITVLVIALQRCFRKVLLSIWRYWAQDAYSTEELTSDKSNFDN